jgi:hypothetical protein
MCGLVVTQYDISLQKSSDALHASIQVCCLILYVYYLILLVEGLNYYINTDMLLKKLRVFMSSYNFVYLHY